MAYSTRIKACVAMALLSTAGGVLAASAPHVSVRDLNGLARPLPLPYDTSADATRQVAQAKLRARQQGKKLLIDLGGNWCPDCRVLAGVMALPEIDAFIRKHYVVVTVDIGQMDKNLAIPGRVPTRPAGPSYPPALA